MNKTEYVWSYNVTPGITPVSRLHYIEALKNIKIIEEQFLAHKNGTNHPSVDTAGAYSGFLRASDVVKINELEGRIANASANTKSRLVETTGGFVAMFNPTSENSLSASAWKLVYSGRTIVGSMKNNATYAVGSVPTTYEQTTDTSLNYIDIPYIRYNGNEIGE